MVIKRYTMTFIFLNLALLSAHRVTTDHELAVRNLSKIAAYHAHLCLRSGIHKPDTPHDVGACSKRSPTHRYFDGEIAPHLHRLAGLPNPDDLPPLHCHHGSAQRLCFLSRGS